MCYLFRVCLDVFNEPYVSKPQRRWQRERFNDKNGLMAKTIAVQLHVRMCQYVFVLKAPKFGQVDFRPGFPGSSS